jgi:predicted GNAT family N-acyltransferase
MTEFRIFSADDHAYRQALDLRTAVLRAPLGLSLNPEDLADDARQLHFGLFEDQHLLACVLAAPRGGGRIKIRQMAVRPDRQGRGLGRALLEQAMAHLAASGFTDFELHARLVVVGFYERLGFQRAGPVFTEVGLPHVRMTRAAGLTDRSVAAGPNHDVVP